MDVGTSGLTVHECDGTLVVVGDLDVLGGEHLDRVLVDIEGAGRAVHLDLAGVTFVDSTGLRSLLAASRRASLSGRRVRIVSWSNVVRRLLDITATTELFER